MGGIDKDRLVERECGFVAVQGPVGATVPNRNRRLRKTSYQLLDITEAQSCCSRVPRAISVPEIW